MRRTTQAAERAARLAVAPTRSYWTTARAGPGGGRRGGAVPVHPPQEMSAGPFAAGGQRRFLADEKKEDKKPQPKAGAGVFATFIKSFRDQMASKVESDEDLAAAQERLEQARLDSIKNAEAAMKRAQEAAEQAKKRAEILEEQTRPAREVVGQPAVQAVGRATMSAATAAIEAQDRLDKKSQEWETRMLESAAAKKVRAAMGEDPRGKGPVQGIAIDHETNAISIYQETAWERRVRKLKESAFLGPIMGGTESVMDAASEVSNRLGDRVFGETEMSLCMAEIKKDDPSFNTRIFLTKLEKETIPFIMNSYLTDQLADMEDMLTERSTAMLGAVIKERLKNGLRLDPTILDLDEVELREARLVDGEPVLIVRYETQQVHCVRNKKGEIMEGSESEIRRIHYVWAMVRNFSEDLSDPPTWKLHEMGIEYQAPLLA
eukprot:CAMPEP_0179445344 /NCGR_PEP_ID=MMETSP0799-20121207/28786_1 /TAXON_ID=46947 /ORGANISM="Geminigera cryophila, Strain CCMP2564" /LENGTH=433 /DNA_ID=CAMNT_0021233285 /DNA_START=139 /DNA_END=1440 /DNA_ORIENTATION=-